MNKTKIEYVDYTWNPVVGCLHGCPYCYARRIAERFKGGKEYPLGFEPTSHLSKRINEPMLVKKPSKIFVCSMADLFGSWSWKVPWSGGKVTGDDVINAILFVVRKCPQHTFMFLTKNPTGYLKYDFPENAWLGMTVTHLEGKRVIYGGDKGGKRFVSLEPLLGGPDGEIEFRNIDLLIIGAQTGPGAVKPKPEWVQGIIDEARAHKIPVFLKDNLKWPEQIREFPEVSHG